jgi:hypothetical protein
MGLGNTSLPFWLFSLWAFGEVGAMVYVFILH